MVAVADAHTPGLLVNPDVVSKQLDAERGAPATGGESMQANDGSTGITPAQSDGTRPVSPAPVAAKPNRFHGSVTLDPTRVGRDASKIAEEVIAHLAGLMGADVTVTENCRTLKFSDHGFESE